MDTLKIYRLGYGSSREGIKNSKALIRETSRPDQGGYQTPVSMASYRHLGV
jgi:hypothetical protein